MTLMGLCGSTHRAVQRQAGQSMCAAAQTASSLERMLLRIRRSIVNTLNAKSAMYGPIGEFGSKLDFFCDVDMFSEERKVEELLDKVEKRIGMAKENVVGLINAMVVR